MTVPPDRCPNCCASLAVHPAPRFCPQCSQATALQPPPLRETARDAIARYRRTLWALLAHPGKLTLEYIAGRRQRYVPPLRLYLAASFVFFLVVKVLSTSGSVHIVVAPAIDVHGKPVTSASDPVAYRKRLDEMQACVDHAGSCPWPRTLGARVGLKAAAQAEHPEAAAQRLVGMAPNAVFVLLPVFAALVMLAYRTRRLPYGAHFVFSLHMHALWFIVLLVLSQLPGDAPLLAALVLPAHAVWALQRVYRGRWWATLCRAVVVMACYFAALLTTMAGLGLASILLA